jgi:hypothetical protein
VVILRIVSYPALSILAAVKTWRFSVVTVQGKPIGRASRVFFLRGLPLRRPQGRSARPNGRNSMTRSGPSKALITAFVLCCAGTSCKVKEGRPAGGTVIGNRPSLDVGDKLCLPGADFSRAKRSLVLVVNYSCAWCSQSDKLLRTFLSRAAREEMPVIVVRSSSNPDEASQALLNVHTSTLVVAPGSVTGIKHIPTVLLVGGNGVVTHLWTGGVEPGKEEETVGGFFEGKGDVTRPLESIDLRGLEELERRKVHFQVVDPAPPMKGNAATGLPGALSIPAADLAIRGPYELDCKQLVILDCRATGAYECQTVSDYDPDSAETRFRACCGSDDGSPWTVSCL